MTLYGGFEGFVRRPGRKVGVYARQSSHEQMINNKGSMAHQLGQREIAKALGYPDELIEVYRDDGLTGSAAAHRPEYRRLVSDIKKGLTDAVIASDASRLSRDANEWLHFLVTCAMHDVRLILDGKLIDPKRGDERFMTSVVALTTEYDNWRRKQASQQARLAKLKQGKAVTPPPSGYVWGPDGTWLKDDRPGVREAIEAHYRALREGRSLVRAVGLLRQWGVDSPARRAKQAIEWVTPEVSTVARFVHHPAYVGDAAYGRRRGDPSLGRDARGRVRARRATEDEVIIITDHHEPYISRGEQAELKALLERNAFGGPHGLLGAGQALGQGVVRCGKHGEWLMSAVWKDTDEHGHVRYDYTCSYGIAQAEKRCGSIPGWVMDKPLLEAVVARLRPHALDELAAAVERAEQDARSEARRRREIRHRLGREIEDLERRVKHVDPKLWTVAQRYEQQMHEKNLQLLRLEEPGDQPPMGKAFQAELLTELRTVCSDLEGLLRAPTTEPRDRKELVRILVDRVIVEVRTREQVRLRIVWNDRTADSVREVLLSPYAHRMIAAWAAENVSPGEVATRLNDLGVETKYHTPWTAKNVVRQLRRMRSATTRMVTARACQRAG
jgi:DNA invertase Pin-like site-specific DNA recombinase